VRVSPGLPEDAGPGILYALNASSRALPPREAAGRVREAVHAGRERGARLLLKKVDSTLRGNLAAELLAAAEAGGFERVVFCPAFPAQGRTLEGGLLRVDGAPLSRAPLFEGGKRSRLPDRPAELLKGAFRTAEIGIETVRGGGLREAISGAPAGAAVCVDAETDEDLDLLAAAVEGEGRWLCAGAAGWARATARRLPGVPPAPAGPSRLSRPAVFLVGSLNPLSRDQARYLARGSGVRLFTVGVERRLEDGAALKDYAARIGEMMGVHLRTDGARAAVVVTDPPPVGVSSRPGAAGEVARWLAELGAGRLWRREAGGLLFCGGDVAQAAWEVLEAGAMRLEEELLPGIPRCRFLGGRYGGLPVVTKPGGFGKLDALSHILSLWRGEEDR